MAFLILALILLVSVVLIALDLARKINLMHGVPLTIYLAAALNAVLLVYGLYHRAFAGFAPGWRVAFLAALGLPALYMTLRLNVCPVLDGRKTGIRLKAMIGGRFLVLRSLWAMLPEAVLLLLAYPRFIAAGVPTALLVGNGIFAAAALFLLLWNGILRIFCTSRRLSVVRRVVMALTMWVPVVNLIVLGYACRLVYEEYDFACYKKDLHLTRVDSDLCKTKYPLIMVHGVLFRDLKYFNYWGRIPRELIRYGATVFYGNQEAVGTIEYNGTDIGAKIRAVLEETGCEKVNIIAHSKGGLDARYAVSALGMAPYVASLTTISTPHRGCRFVDFACRLPEGFLRFLAKLFDNAFRKLGDQNPDFFTAVHQFTTQSSAAFNEEIPDAPGVYYQSYMTRLKSFLGDSLLAVPYLLIKPLEGMNDGLVSVPSAQWGEFRGVLTSKGRRGVSHGDIIDLKREDYKGFDVLEAYVGIVSDLREQGF